MVDVQQLHEQPFDVALAVFCEGAGVLAPEYAGEEKLWAADKILDSLVVGCQLAVDARHCLPLIIVPPVQIRFLFPGVHIDCDERPVELAGDLERKVLDGVAVALLVIRKSRGAVCGPCPVRHDPVRGEAVYNGRLSRSVGAGQNHDAGRQIGKVQGDLVNTGGPLLSLKTFKPQRYRSHSFPPCWRMPAARCPQPRGLPAMPVSLQFLLRFRCWSFQPTHELFFLCRHSADAFRSDADLWDNYLLNFDVRCSRASAAFRIASSSTLWRSSSQFHRPHGRARPAPRRQPRRSSVIH